MDVSSAFDTLDREILLRYLQNVLPSDELHMVKTLLEAMKLSVQVGNKMGKPFDTTVGTPQEESRSPTLFTLYLTKPWEMNNIRSEPSYIQTQTARASPNPSIR